MLALIGVGLLFILFAGASIVFGLAIGVFGNKPWFGNSDEADEVIYDTPIKSRSQQNHKEIIYNEPNKSKYEKCLLILDLEPGTPHANIKQAYKNLVKVWHPDRFSHDTKLQALAQNKLKEINDAYKYLTS